MSLDTSWRCRVEFRQRTHTEQRPTSALGTEELWSFSLLDYNPFLLGSTVSAENSASLINRLINGFAPTDNNLLRGLAPNAQPIRRD